MADNISSSKTIQLIAPIDSTKPYTLESYFEETATNTTTNKSTIYCRATLSATHIAYESSNGGTLYVYWYDNKTKQETLISETVIESCGMKFGSKTVEGYIYPTHNDDGSLSGYAKATFVKNKSSNYIPATGSVSTDTTKLKFIPRTSDPTLSVSEINVGESITITMNRNSEEFVHKIYYSIDDGSETCLATNVQNSYSWIVPKNMANKITMSDNGIMKFRVVTVYNNTDIGSSEIRLKIKIPDTEEFKPVINSVELQECGSVPDDLRFYVQNKSKINGVIHAGGAYGSTIKSYQVSFNNELFVNSSFLTSILTQVNPVLKVTVVDTRDRKAVYENVITVLKYEIPTITSFISQRNENNPVKLDVSLSCTIYNLNEKNTAIFKFYYKKSTDTNYSSVTINLSELTIVKQDDFTLYSGTLSMIDSDTSASYNTYLEVTDIFNPIKSSIESVGTIFKLINISADKTSLSIGKLHEVEGHLENALPQINYEDIIRKKADYQGIVLSSSSIQDGIVRVDSGFLKFDSDNKEYKIVLYSDAKEPLDYEVIEEWED